MASRGTNPVKVIRADGSTAKIGAGALPTALKLAVFQRDGFRCRYCGHEGASGHFEVDHVRPRSKGGTDEMSNLVVACWLCNAYKGAATWTPGQKPWRRSDFDRTRWNRMKANRSRKLKGSGRGRRH